MDSTKSDESDSLNNEHSATMFSEGRCRCGCIPQNVCSLFEMAEKRKKYRLKKQQEEATAAAAAKAKTETVPGTS